MPTDASHFRKMQQVKSYCKCTATAFVNENRSESNLTTWNNYSFPNRFKVFLFKYYNNILGTNNRVAHFNRETNAACFFCQKSLNLPAPAESFAHVFYDCPSVQKIIERFSEKFLTIEVTRDKFFSGFYTETEKENRSINLIMDSVRYCIWQSKLTKKNISYNTIEYETINLLDIITGASKKFENSIITCPFINVDRVADNQRQADGGGP